MVQNYRVLGPNRVPNGIWLWYIVHEQPATWDGRGQHSATVYPTIRLASFTLKLQLWSVISAADQ